MTLLNLRIEGHKGVIEGKFDEVFDLAKAKRLLRDAIDDIADAVEGQVQRTVPVESGALKLHPLEREDTRLGVVEPRVFLFARGGGPGDPGIRGAGGQIVGAVPGGIGGDLVARSTITLPEKPEHALWVHDGTGIYGPTKRPIRPHTADFMVFPRWSKARSNRKWFRLKSVKGQKAQPYLTEAYLLIDKTYIPARIELLRAQIAAAI